MMSQLDSLRKIATDPVQDHQALGGRDRLGHVGRRHGATDHRGADVAEPVRDVTVFIERPQARDTAMTGHTVLGEDRLHVCEVGYRLRAGGRRCDGAHVVYIACARVGVRTSACCRHAPSRRPRCTRGAACCARTGGRRGPRHRRSRARTGARWSRSSPRSRRRRRVTTIIATAQTTARQDYESKRERPHALF